MKPNKIPLATMRVTFRDKDHFYKVVAWLNANVGRSSKDTPTWNISGNTLKKLKRQPTGEVTKNIHIYVPMDDAGETTMYLGLI